MENIYDQVSPITQEDRARAGDMLLVSSIAYGLAEIYKHITRSEPSRIGTEILQSDLKPQIKANYLAFNEGVQDEAFLDSLGMRKVVEKMLEKRCEPIEKHPVI